MDGNPVISNFTISNNSAAEGGAISCNGSSSTFYNTVFWGNTASARGNQVYLEDETSDPNFNYYNVEDSLSAFGLNSTSYTGTYANNINAIPMFTAPSGGSGTGFDGLAANWQLSSSFPCINAGTPDTTGLSFPAYDINGNPRVSNNRVDIGAYEFNANSILENSNVSSINIYPNPADKYFTIDGIIPVKMEIIDMRGKLIKNINMSDKSSAIDISKLPAGVYSIRIITDDGIILKKLIKQ